MPTLILSPRYTPDSNLLWKAAIQQGWTVERLHSYAAPLHSRDHPIILYGEGLFARAVAEINQLRLIEAPLDWLSSLPKQYSLREICAMTLEQARHANFPAFIKPAIDKTFAAKIYQSPNELPAENIVDEQMMVLVSEPVIWEVEFRCFVSDRKCQTLSAYLRMGDLLDDSGRAASEQEQSEAKNFIERMLNDVSVDVPGAIVIDIGKIAGRGWAVVESNPAWASGIYGCEPISVLNVLKQSCISDR